MQNLDDAGELLSPATPRLLFDRIALGISGRLTGLDYRGLQTMRYALQEAGRLRRRRNNDPRCLTIELQLVDDDGQFLTELWVELHLQQAAADTFQIESRSEIKINLLQALRRALGIDDEVLSFDGKHKLCWPHRSG